MRISNLVAAFSLITAPAIASAQNPVTWTLSSNAGSGKKVLGPFELVAHIAKGWHIYAISQQAGGPIATSAVIAPGSPYTLVAPLRPSVAPRMQYDDAFKMKVLTHEGDVTYRFSVKPTAAAKETDSLRIDTRYQACNASLCMPPRRQHLAIAVARKA